MFCPSVCLEGSIVISGGLGGLALEMSKWMIEERGVTSLVLLSRRPIAELDPHSPQINEWNKLKEIAEKHRASVEVFQVDITDFHQVRRVISEVHRLRPIRGILHSAMVLDDCLLTKMTTSIFAKVCQPKIDGAWNLHCAAQHCQLPLHFFVLFSSIRNHLPGEGQSNYNAGNHFLDSLAHWRVHSRHLPALSIGLPAISGAGYLHRVGASLIPLMESQGVHLLPVREVFPLLEQLHFLQRTSDECWTSPAVFAVDWSILLAGQLSSKVRHFAEETHRTARKVTLSEDDRSLFTVEKLTPRIRQGVSTILGSANVERIEVTRPLIEQGLDSLTAVELRTWLIREMGIAISVVELSQGMSIADLALFVEEQISSRTKHLASSSSGEVSNASTSESSSPNIDRDADQDQLSLISPLLSSGSGVTLFCIHDIIGLSQTFVRLAVTMHQTFGERCPSIFAFRASGYRPGEPFLHRLEEIAEEYIFQMKQIQPNGPFHLLGYSFGGLLAYEIARQLHQSNQTTVQSLILIDPLCPVEDVPFLPPDVDEEHFWSWRTLGFIDQYLFVTRPVDHSSSFSADHLQRRMNGTLPVLQERFQRLTKCRDEQMASRIFQIIRAQTRASKCYTLHQAENDKERLVDVPAVLFTLTSKNNELKQQIWRRLLTNLHLRSVEGTHQTMLESPTLDSILEQFSLLPFLFV